MVGDVKKRSDVQWSVEKGPRKAHSYFDVRPNSQVHGAFFCDFQVQRKNAETTDGIRARKLHEASAFREVRSAHVCAHAGVEQVTCRITCDTCALLFPPFFDSIR